MFKFDIAKFFKTSKSSNNYLVLTFFEGEVMAGIYTQENNNGSLLTIRNKWLNFGGDFEKLSIGLDEFLLNFEKKSGIRLEKTIFFFSGEFTSSDTNEIEVNFFAKVKEFASAMELHVDGYLFLDELFASQFVYKYQESVFIELLFESVRVSVYFGEKIQHSFKVNYEDDLIETLEKARRFLLDENIEAEKLNNFVLYGQELALDQIKLEKYRGKLEHFVKGFGGEGEILSDKMLEELLYFGLRKLLFGENRDNLGNIQANSLGSSMSLLNSPETIEDEKTHIDDHTIEPGQSAELKYNGYLVDPIEVKPSLTSHAEAQINNPQGNEYAPKAKNPKWKIPTSSLNTRFVMGDYIFAISTFIICFIVFAYFYPKQIITLYYKQNNSTISKQLTVGSGLLELDYQQEFDVSQEATGRKLVGEKSKGTIQISSLEKQARTYKSGSRWKSGDKVFVLDDDVTLASASANLTSEGNLLTIASKAVAKITAGNIGAEYNLPKGSKLTPDGSDSLVSATLQEASNGGTSEEVVFISKGDLLDSTGKVIELVKQDINDKMSKKGKLVSMKIKIDNSSLPSVGSETKTLQYKAKVLAKLVLIDEEYLKKTENLAQLYYQIEKISAGDSISVNILLENSPIVTLSDADQNLIKTYSAKKLKQNSKLLSKVPYGYSVKKVRSLGVFDIIGSSNKSSQIVKTESR